MTHHDASELLRAAITPELVGVAIYSSREAS